MVDQEVFEKELVGGRMYNRYPINAKIEHIKDYFNNQIKYYLENNKIYDKLYEPFENITLQNTRNTIIRPLVAIKQEGSENDVDFVLDYAVDDKDYLAYCIKPMIFLEQGIKEYWIADITNDTLTIYNLEKSGLIQKNIDIPRRINIGLYRSLFLNFTEIFNA